MKLIILQNEFESQPLLNQLFLALWKQRKGYEGELRLDQLIELACALTPDFHTDTPNDRSTFNNGLHYSEMFYGWDGDEPIEILWFELNQKLRRRINQYLVVNNKIE